MHGYTDERFGMFLFQFLHGCYAPHAKAAPTAGCLFCHHLGDAAGDAECLLHTLSIVFHPQLQFCSFVERKGDVGIEGECDIFPRIDHRVGIICRE